MKLNVKTKRRRFELKFCLPFPEYICEKYAKEVVESIEKDELLVFDPKDAQGLNVVLDDKGADLLLDRAKIPVKIREWLPVGCQCIRYEKFEEFKDDSLGHYSCNALNVLWPVYSHHKPEGPAAFIGEIVISKNLILPNLKKPFFEDKVKCLIAHELIHVFDYLRFIVPAFLNWRSFWHTFIDEGLSSEDLCSRLGDISSFVDRYGSQIELSCLQEFWPSQAKKWFNAFRRDYKQKKKKQVKKKAR